jgi:hypothetical protein
MDTDLTFGVIASNVGLSSRMIVADRHAGLCISGRPGHNLPPTALSRLFIRLYISPFYRGFLRTLSLRRQRAVVGSPPWLAAYRAQPCETNGRTTMKRRTPAARGAIVLTLSLLLMTLALAPPKSFAQQQFVIATVADKKFKELPPGTLYWRLENFPTLAQAREA